MPLTLSVLAPMLLNERHTFIIRDDVCDFLMKGTRSSLETMFVTEPIPLAHSLHKRIVQPKGL